MRCLAAPIYSSDGVVVAAIGITAATVRFTSESIPEIGAIVMESAARLSRLMGYQAR